MVNRSGRGRVLITGADGYLGCVLAPILLNHGYEVTGVDTGFYREGLLFTPSGSQPIPLARDIRMLCESDLGGFDAVVHMAELSNDPAGDLSPSVTYEINHRGSLRLAQLAKAAGVPRFIYMSSCSVYGIATQEMVSEESTVNPQTVYAECKALVERDLKNLADGTFTPVILRNATAYGASPRMRFDLVLNNLAGLAWTTGRIAMTSDGTPWRPLVHAEDICKAIMCAVEAPVASVYNQIFNVGSTSSNYQVRDIAETVADVFPGCALEFGPGGADNRSYRVCFDKIHSRLPGFRCDWDMRHGAEQLREVFSRVSMDSETFSFRAFTRTRQLKHLLETGQLDRTFFWQKEFAADVRA